MILTPFLFEWPWPQVDFVGQTDDETEKPDVSRWETLTPQQVQSHVIE